MAPALQPVRTHQTLPSETEVVVIGGGIVGLFTALTLAERGLPVTLLEKGRLAGEQSSRNLGWVRKMMRSAADLPMAQEADRMWAEMPTRIGADCGYTRAGIMYVAQNDAEMANYENWLNSVAGRGLDSRLLSRKDISDLAPRGVGDWVGGIYTPSDGRSEPTLSAPAVATAAIKKGAVIIENCAVRHLSMRAGAVDAVLTERGPIACKQVILAGGTWSRRFLNNLGVNLLTLPLVASVLRTKPMDGPSDIALGASNFSFRKRLDGGYTITQRGALFAPLTLDHLLIGLKYLPTLRAQWHNLRVSIGKEFLDDLRLPRRWGLNSVSPFEKLREVDPPVNQGLNDEAMRNLIAAWPEFAKVEIAESWGGMIDVTPDSLPVISPIDKIPGLILASGFSGHGFGTAPAAGELAADLAMGRKPLVDPAPYRFDRF